MLRDFPITGNEGATMATEYQQMNYGMFVPKGHGLKELDKIASSKSDVDNFVIILHIDSSREGVDYIQFDSNFYRSGSITLLSRGQTSQLTKDNELAFRAMRGEKVARPLPFPNATEVWNLDFGTGPKAFIRTEDLLGTKYGDTFYFFTRDRYNVYKGHGFLPGDIITLEETDSGNPFSLHIVDIIPNDGYDEIVLEASPHGYRDNAVLSFQGRLEDSSLSPDQLAKRNAYISKLQAS